jgi:hypothetical protein
LKFRRFRRSLRCNSRAFAPQWIFYLDVAPGMYADLAAVGLKS